MTTHRPPCETCIRLYGQANALPSDVKVSSNLRKDRWRYLCADHAYEQGHITGSGYPPALYPGIVVSLHTEETQPEPTKSIESLMWDFDQYGYTVLPCGCNVEPDGTCPCGNQSPLLEMGLI
jgi:hypothetical protein